KYILCPYCTETCSTNWNLRIHIQRKHNGKAKPATPGSYATSSTQFNSFDVSRNMATANDRQYYQDDNNNGNYHHQTCPSCGHISEQDSKKLKKSSSFKERDAAHELRETIREALEIINITKQLRPSTFWQPSIIGEGGITWPFSSFITPASPNLSSSCNSSTRNMWGINKNIGGFQGYVCYNCLSYWAQSFEGDTKSLIQVKPNHQCDPKKVAHALNLLDLQNKKNGLYGELIDFLVTLAKYLIVRAFFSRRKIYLRVEELVPTSYPSDFTDRTHDNNVQPAATNNSNKDPLLSTLEEQHTDLTNTKENNLAYHMIKEGEQLEKSIEMNNDEVIEFVKTAKGTFGIFRIKTNDNRIKERYFLMYIVF
ncbi:MAG: hypothetical protein ACTHKP_11195, partial [Nitrososphaeraceae archaeon]